MKKHYIVGLAVILCISGYALANNTESKEELKSTVRINSAARSGVQISIGITLPGVLKVR